MDTTGRADLPYILWGGQLSVYTAKVRSYLIKKRIPYREQYPAHPDFAARIIPELGFFVIPVLEVPGDGILQDTSDMMDYLEIRHPEPCFVPSTPVQQVVASLLCAFGSEGLNQPSMHYRWSFLAEHGDYIRTEFGRAASPSHSREERVAAAEPTLKLMTDHLPRMGISPESIPAIESAYLDLLKILDDHFLLHPYLLGGRPSMADFGMMAGLYAHLSRDPVPSALMKSVAPNVYRWTERMNVANVDDGEFPDAGDLYPAEDAIPETIVPLLKLVFADWGAELLATAAGFNDWLADNPQLDSGDLASASGDRQVHPSVGRISYKLRDATVTRDCWPHTLWHFNRVQTVAGQLQGESRQRWDQLVECCDGATVMAIELSRSLRRQSNVLVLG